MIAVVQRVAEAAVEVEGERIATIGAGLLVLLGIHRDDTHGDLEYTLRKTLSLRIFGRPTEDTLSLRIFGRPTEERSIMDAAAELLVVSQFTLLADVRKGRRPSYANAARGAAAEGLYERFVDEARRSVPTQSGRFGANMRVRSTNQGPLTILIDSHDRRSAS